MGWAVLKPSVAVALALAFAPLAAQQSGSAGGQKAKFGAAPAATAPGPAHSGSVSGSGGSGFAIEAEMQAYKALQSNSEAIACDIASFLMRTPTAPLQPNGPNAVVGGRYRPLASACSSALAAAPTGVVVLDASGGTLQSLQLWRTDMAMMDWMQTAADSVCTAPAAPAGAPALTGEAPGGTMGLIGTGVTTGLGEVGTAIQLLKLIAPSETATGLTGTIGDRALMDGVSRQLRVLGVPIFMPDAMAPLLFAYPSARHPSPLFSAMAKLSATQSCLQTKSAAGNADAKTTLAAVQGFLTSLSTAAVGQPSPLQAAMAGDELEQAIGAGASDPKPPAWHLLLLQALESGGSEITHGGLFGSGVEYSGGSVATYELFDLRGSLTCSGNVFDYGGERSPDDLSRDFLRPNLAPGRQLIFLRGGCAPEPAH